MKNLQNTTAGRQLRSTWRKFRGDAHRTQSGQALAEGAGVLMLIAITFVLLLMMLINVFAIMTVDTKLNFIANEVVRQRTEDMYWLGLTRYDIDPQVANSRAENLAKAIAGAAGIPVSGVKVKQVNLQANGQSFLGAECKITTTSIALPFGGGVFPTGIPRTVRAVSASAPAAPPSVVSIDPAFIPGIRTPPPGVPYPANPGMTNVRFFMPCYGAYYGGLGIGAQPVPAPFNIPMVNLSTTTNGSEPGTLKVVPQTVAAVNNGLCQLVDSPMR